MRLRISIRCVHRQCFGMPCFAHGADNSRFLQAKLALPSSPARALRHASRAMEEASRAYFNPTMLALLYFPDEHKYTVYAPFFGPVAVPLLAALAREAKVRHNCRPFPQLPGSLIHSRVLLDRNGRRSEGRPRKRVRRGTSRPGKRPSELASGGGVAQAFARGSLSWLGWG